MKTMKLDRVMIGSDRTQFDPKTRSGCYKRKKKTKPKVHSHTTHTNHNSHFHNTQLLTQTLTTLNPQSHYTIPNLTTQNTYTVTPNGIGPMPSRQWRPPHKSQPHPHLHARFTVHLWICCYASMATDLLQAPPICCKVLQSFNSSYPTRVSPIWNLSFQFWSFV